MKQTLVSVIAIVALVVPAAAVGRDSGDVREELSRPIVTARGVGAVHLGDTIRSLRRRHLIKHLGPGCELEPGQRVARLRQFNGYAIFGPNSSRVRSIGVLGGARTAKGVTIGSSPGLALHAYPEAEYSPPGSNPPFDIGLIWVNNPETPRMTFIVDQESHRISEIDVPEPNFCE